MTGSLRCRDIERLTLEGEDRALSEAERSLDRGPSPRLPGLPGLRGRPDAHPPRARGRPLAGAVQRARPPNSASPPGTPTGSGDGGPAGLDRRRPGRRQRRHGRRADHRPGRRHSRHAPWPTCPSGPWRP
ncbi:MAG: hypothetical protein M0C28_12125 [Candidatus Moduliflexus flocculans]|nr:hypothetical protein [Candidatus Moduliflexus flocculans]